MANFHSYAFARTATNPPTHATKLFRPDAVQGQTEATGFIPPAMIQQRRPSGFIEPCQPSKVARPPSGPLWVEPAARRSWSRKSGASVVLTTLGASELSLSCVRNHYARCARDQVKAACIRDHVEPHGDDLPVPQPLPIALS
jgi:hypothetical protein